MRDRNGLAGSLPNIPCETRIRNFDEVFRTDKRIINEPKKAGKEPKELFKEFKELKEKGNKDIKDDFFSVQNMKTVK